MQGALSAVLLQSRGCFVQYLSPIQDTFERFDLCNRSAAGQMYSGLILVEVEFRGGLEIYSFVFLILKWCPSQFELLFIECPQGSFSLCDGNIEGYLKGFRSKSKSQMRLILQLYFPIICCSSCVLKAW